MQKQKVKKKSFKKTAPYDLKTLLSQLRNQPTDQPWSTLDWLIETLEAKHKTKTLMKTSQCQKQ